MIDEEKRQAVISYRLKNAYQTLDDIQVLIDGKLWNIAMSRLYYACYYAVSALLLSKCIETQTHAGVRQMLGKHFVNTELLSKEHARFYSLLFTNRHESDYEDFIDFREEEIMLYYPRAIVFVKEIEKLL